MKILVVKTINGFLKPAYGSDSDTFAKMPINETFEIGKRLATWKNRSVAFEKPTQPKLQSVTDKNPYHVIQ